MTNISSLTFLGGAGTVTGSKYLIETPEGKVLLDAGLFQGLKELRLRNWSEPEFDPSLLSAVILSHAHLDHSGYLPVLVKKGFKGPVYCTSGTQDLLQILLLDAAHLQEEQAAHANKHGYSKHKPALALYGREDAVGALGLLAPQNFGQLFAVTKTLSVRFRRAAHILGAASVELFLNGSKLVFSGDLGRWNQPLLKAPEPVEEADTLLIESTYGNRIHPETVREELIRVILASVKHGGPLIIPAFAVGRTQELIWMIRRLEDEGAIPVLQVFMDSPMAIDASSIYQRHSGELDHGTGGQTGPLATRHFHVLKTREESKKLNALSGPMIILSSSGMATGGRILHHLEQRLNDRRTTVLLAGFQAKGTRGRALEEGAEQLKIHGAQIPVRAVVEKIEGLSAHADQKDLLRWLSGFKQAPRRTFVVHGEPEASQGLAEAIRSSLGWTSVRPALNGEVIPL